MNVIEIRGQSGVHKMLADYMVPKLPRRLQDATKAGATVFKKPLQSEARKVSKRMGQDVKVVRAARDRPATIVKFGKKAWFDHFVIGGTRDHGPRRADALAFQGRNGFVVTKHVRGVKPNPMVARVANAHQGAAYAAIDKSLDRTEAT